MKPQTKRYLMYSAYIIVLLVGFFVAGPLIDAIFMAPNMPYLIIDKSMEAQARLDCNCGNLPSRPVEATITSSSQLVTDGTTATIDFSNPNLIKLPVEKVPVEYLQYVHYPESWDKWWNPFNPENQFSIWFSRVFSVLAVCGAITVVVYFIITWRRKRFKFQRKN